MSDNKAHPSVLLVGLPASHHAIPADKRDSVAKSLSEVDQQLKSAGIEGEFLPVDEDITAEEFLAKLPMNLDGLVLGGGIRMLPGKMNR